MKPLAKYTQKHFKHTILNTFTQAITLNTTKTCNTPIKQPQSLNNLQI